MNSHKDRNVDRTDSNREDLGRYEVWYREPTDRPSDSVDVDGCDSSATSCHGRRAGLDLLGSPTVRDLQVGSNKGQSENLHDDTSHEGSATTYEVDDKDGEDKNGDKLQDGVASSRQEPSFCACDSEVSKDGRAVLGNGIGSRPLAEYVASKHQCKAATVANVSERLFDQVPSIGTRNNLNLVVELRLDALELRLHIRMILGQSAEATKNSEGLSPFVLAKKESRSLGGEKGTNTPDQGRYKLKCCGKLPLKICSSVVFCDTVIEEKPEDDAELLAACVLKREEASDWLRRNLEGHVSWLEPHESRWTTVPLRCKLKAERWLHRFQYRRSHGSRKGLQDGHC